MAYQHQKADVRTMSPIKKRDVIAVIIGNGIEFFDFLIYSTFTVFIAQVFFPSKDSFTNILATVSVYGIGFVARPIGAFIIGTYADKHGRKSAMLITMLLMAIGTFGMVFIPSYQTIGMAAPILLVIARIAQGLAWGGEAGPATSYMMEAAPKNKRAFYTSWQIVAQGAAAFIAGFIGYILSLYLNDRQMQDWGWRIPFALGIGILPVSLYMRRHLQDTLTIKEVSKNHIKKSSQSFIKNAFQNHFSWILIGIFMLSGSTVTQYFLNYVTTYALEDLHFNKTTAMVASLIMGLVMMAFALIGGLCADYFGRHKTILYPRLILLVLLWPGLYLVNLSNNAAIFFIVIILFTALQNISGAGIVVLLCENFPKHIRATAFSLSYTLGITIFGGSAQIIFTWLLDKTHNAASLAFYLIIMNILTITAVYWSGKVGKMQKNTI